MHVISVDRTVGTAYVAWYADHRPVCSMDGRVKYGQACTCPQWATNIEVPLDEVEAQLRDPLPPGYQDPWVTIKDVSGRVEYEYGEWPDGNPKIIGVKGFVRHGAGAMMDE